jgi:hypothetical protein
MRKVIVQLQDRGTGREELKERHSLIPEQRNRKTEIEGKTPSNSRTEEQEERN